MSPLYTRMVREETRPRLGGDPWGAKQVVYWLEKANRAIEDEQERWRSVSQGGVPNR
jgi:hypothetical protein